MRRLIAIACEGSTLAGTLDEAAGTTGLLIVSGGNEIRAGAHLVMAMLAQRLAAAGWPVLRFDRRGIGDSEGENEGFEASGPDIEAAAAAFRTHCPQLRLIAGFGNCDAATALALFGTDAGIDALILANPWVIEPADDLPPPAAIRARYAGRLLSLDGWKRLLTGAVDLRALLRGIGAIARPAAPSGLAVRLGTALSAFRGSIRIILAEADATALAFADAWRKPAFAALAARIAIDRIQTGSHSFARGDDPERLAMIVMTALLTNASAEADR